ncbi:hypothetical protein CFR78_10475 [Komagataeibacter rhaeticus]|uniref:Uncharacterized protein n=2 Tax=Komagataeibacter rhaeticus TaxID=215221 RepID=A0A181CAI4_9PROT|nr:hypothetical protein [Komagataeibacter rhaeticus]ATU72925.1 hypothetical protein CT154_08795 [Komagataeibacter xylinus]EGG76785.1 hypothetical protein SXCC_02535 [Gluconacetobacter sp. SXCC-1]KDU94284.1 hypothetical protein GLUCORHAEAF1_14885 [Komagataeibacter rhaeticus AF1]PYD53189.1 hypothetical protein CFR78_10475 [Komagataeibacter rhaeticus]QIP35328.1 hypothetical protein GWK63_07495 [Komagataeibacter rhaeticus]
MLPSPSVTERARVAALLRADRRARLLARDIAAGLKPDMGATGPAATARVVETTRMELAPHTRPRPVRRVLDTCVLDRLFHRANAALTPEQHAVGLRFRATWRRAVRAGRLVQCYTPHTGAGGGASLEDAEASMQARRRLDRAHALLTPARWQVVCAVCGMDEQPGTRLRTLHRALDVLHDQW